MKIEIKVILFNENKIKKYIIPFIYLQKTNLIFANLINMVKFIKLFKIK